MSESNDSVLSVARELWECARRWQPEARLLGNVRAADIKRLCELVVMEWGVGDPAIQPESQCTCHQPTRLGYCPVHEQDKMQRP